jgi:hypothetical protein
VAQFVAWLLFGERLAVLRVAAARLFVGRRVVEVPLFVALPFEGPLAVQARLCRLAPSFPAQKIRCW